MSLKTSNTALLVFIRDPEREAEHKVFAEHIGCKGNEKVARVLSQRIIRLCQETEIPTYVYSTFQQEGETFGVRIANAFEAIFDQGFENVIAVGNDCLAISKKTIHNAENALRQNDMVLGPAQDGGLYLIGLSRAVYQRKQFINFDWTTEKLSQDFLNFANRFNFSFELFEMARDIDDARDFAKAMKSLPHSGAIKKLLENILQITKKKVFLRFEDNIKKLFYLDYTSLRAPPLYLLY